MAERHNGDLFIGVQFRGVSTRHSAFAVRFRNRDARSTMKYDRPCDVRTRMGHGEEPSFVVSGCVLVRLVYWFAGLGHLTRKLAPLSEELHNAVDFH